MLKTLKESVEKLPRSGFVHLANICNQSNLQVSNKCFIHCPAEDKAETIIY